MFTVDDRDALSVRVQIAIEYCDMRRSMTWIPWRRFSWANKIIDLSSLLLITGRHGEVAPKNLDGWEPSFALLDEVERNYA